LREAEHSFLSALGIGPFKDDDMSNKQRIAIPTGAPGGLNAGLSSHFGHTPELTLVDLEGKNISGNSVLQNPPHTKGGCMAPVNLLKENKVDVIIVGGLGARPLMGFNQVGIRVMAGASGSAGSAVTAYLEGKLKQAGDDVVCGHSKTGDCEH
jgi:predicted Fe-Mo cluster-binding NifX family protein